QRVKRQDCQRLRQESLGEQDNEQSPLVAVTAKFLIQINELEPGRVQPSVEHTADDAAVNPVKQFVREILPEQEQANQRANEQTVRQQRNRQRQIRLEQRQQAATAEDDQHPRSAFQDHGGDRFFAAPRGVCGIIGAHGIAT